MYHAYLLLPTPLSKHPISFLLLLCQALWLCMLVNTLHHGLLLAHMYPVSSSKTHKLGGLSFPSLLRPRMI
ncbi:hypothetical protein C8J55DRAFT_496378 [Lentinula edodes]|uniref:Uncharacterized protein n=1 Tax=Lentinula lateritia TaxID=40482 RepID=A0A9W9E186_9AGAR|nr:hypothetical protein C8J55DRAFT_496378 [Lentinula edodes]